MGAVGGEGSIESSPCLTLPLTQPTLLLTPAPSTSCSGVPGGKGQAWIPCCRSGVHWLSPISPQQAEPVFRSEGGSRGKGTSISQGSLWGWGWGSLLCGGISWQVLSCPTFADEHVPSEHGDNPLKPHSREVAAWPGLSAPRPLPMRWRTWQP